MAIKNNAPHGALGIGFKPAWYRPGMRLLEGGEGAGAPAVTPSQGEGDAGDSATDWKAEARKWEQRAKDNLRSARANEDAAKRLAEIEEEQKTEAEKAAERLAAAEKRAAELEAKATRAEVAAAKGVEADMLAHVPVDQLEAFADKLAALKAASAKGPIVDGVGKTPKQTRPEPAPGVARMASAFDDAMNNN